MNEQREGLTHEQAQRYLQSGEPLRYSEQAALDSHLQSCASCRRYSAVLAELGASLAAGLPPAETFNRHGRRQLPAIQEEVRRRRLGRRFSSLFSTLSWAGAALLLVLVFSWAIRNAISRPALNPPASPVAALPLVSSATPEAGLSPTPSETLPPTPSETPEGTDPRTPQPTRRAPVAATAIATTAGPSTDMPGPASPVDQNYSRRTGWLTLVSERDGYATVMALQSNGQGLAQVFAALGGLGSPSWSPDGKRLAVQANSPTDGSLDIFSVRPNGDELKALKSGPANDTQPAWSPDGKKIAYVSDRDRSGTAEIYVMNADGSRDTRLTRLAAKSGQPRWSPDGSRIAFYSEKDGNPEIYVMNADGSNVRRLTDNPASDSSPTWSPDGTRIAFVSERDGKSDIFVMFSDGSAPTNVTNSADVWDYAPAWSPDGGTIAFLRTAGAEPGGVYIIYPDGTGLQLVGNTGATDSSPVWYPLSDRQPPVSSEPRPGTEPTPATAQPLPDASPAPDTTDAAQAEAALRAFFIALSSEQYSEAAKYFGGSYQPLIDANPTANPKDLVGLLRAACEANGYVCLRVRQAALQGQPVGNVFTFVVDFAGSDGTPFVLTSGGQARNQFTFSVAKTADGRFLVQQLPVYQS